VEQRQGGLGALEGLDLSRLLAAGPLSPAQATVVGLGILSALEDVHEAGRSLGSLSAEDILIGADGRVRLRRPGHEHASSSEQSSDVREAGRALCWVLGIAVEPEPGALRPAERAMPAVAATARAIANGAMGRNIGLARAQFADTAGSLVAPERLRLSETELAEHVRAVPASAPAPTPTPTPASGPAPAPAAANPPELPPRIFVDRAAARPVTNWEARQGRRFEDTAPGPPLGRIAAIVGVLLVLIVAGGLGAYVVSKLMVSSGPAPAPVVASPPPASAPASPSPQPSAAVSPTAAASVPTYAPPSQGAIKSVALALNGNCAVAASCALEVTLNFTKAAADTDYAWTFKAFDPCSNATTDVGTGHFTARASWIQIISDRTVTLPAARGQIYVVAVTTSPDQAQSPALSVGQGSC